MTQRIKNIFLGLLLASSLDSILSDPLANVSSATGLEDQPSRRQLDFQGKPSRRQTESEYEPLPSVKNDDTPNYVQHGQQPIEIESDKDEPAIIRVAEVDFVGIKYIGVNISALQIHLATELYDSKTGKWSSNGKYYQIEIAADTVKVSTSPPDGEVASKEKKEFFKEVSNEGIWISWKYGIISAGCLKSFNPYFSWQHNPDTGPFRIRYIYAFKKDNSTGKWKFMPGNADHKSGIVYSTNDVAGDKVAYKTYLWVNNETRRLKYRMKTTSKITCIKLTTCADKIGPNGTQAMTACMSPWLNTTDGTKGDVYQADVIGENMTVQHVRRKLLTPIFSLSEYFEYEFEYGSEIRWNLIKKHDQTPFVKVDRGKYDSSIDFNCIVLGNSQGTAGFEFFGNCVIFAYHPPINCTDCDDIQIPRTYTAGDGSCKSCSGQDQNTPQNTTFHDGTL